MVRKDTRIFHRNNHPPLRKQTLERTKNHFLGIPASGQTVSTQSLSYANIAIVSQQQVYSANLSVANAFCISSLHTSTTSENVQQPPTTNFCFTDRLTFVFTQRQIGLFPNVSVRQKFLDVYVTLCAVLRVGEKVFNLKSSFSPINASHPTTE